MFFKTLKIQGFKSFADKTVLSFDTKTTAVVGSNGNGKSNISDALRWVMGEQGAKTLRGDKMEDVIFHGTVERKPMGFASVSLVIDNSDRALNIDENEIEISRKLYRTGESEYSINGKKTRLKDVQELLMGTGLGRDGYSIIGQGRVAEIVNSRDTQRREIFEEAAGVSLFLHKKADAEKQLAQAAENITRQHDLIRADEERLPVLKKQSEKAALASELMAQKKELEISVSAAKLKEKRAELQKLSDDILLNRSECEHYERDIKRSGEEIEKLANEKLSKNASLNRIRSEIKSASDILSEKNAALKVAENDLEHNKTRRAELMEQLEKAQQSDSAFDKQIDEVREEIAKKNDEIASFDVKISDAQQKFDEISKENTSSGEEFSALESEIAEAYREKTEYSLTVTQSKLSVEDVEKQRAAFSSGVSDAEEKIAEYNAELSAAKKKASEIVEEKSAAENRLGGMERLSQSRKKRLDDARTALEDVNRTLGEKQQRYKVLSDIEKSKEGYNRSVKEVISAGEQGRLSGIHGIVADVLTVPQKYVTAIETVLQPVMQNIIVDNEQTAQRCIQFLNETGAGRATFYPLTSMKGRSLNEQGLRNEIGFEGIANELVEFDNTYRDIIGNLLGTTVVVDDLSTATVIGKKYGYKFRIVTLDGQVVNAGGSFTGGSRISKGGIISRKQEIDALYTEVKALRENEKTKRDEFEKCRAEYAKFSIELEGMQDKIRELDREDISVGAEISRLMGLIEQLTQQKQTSDKTLRNFEEQISRLNETINGAKAKIDEISAKIELLEKEHSVQSEQRGITENKIKSLYDSISALNMDKMSAIKDIDSLNERIKNIEENRRTLLENSGDYKKLMTSLDNSDREIRERIERLKREISDRGGELTDKNAEIESYVKEIEELEREVNELHKNIGELNREKEKFTGTAARLEERKASTQNEYDRIVALLFDSYELTVQQAEKEAKLPENLLEAEAELKELTKKITDLGSVNMASIEEYREVSQRYEFQSAQLRDIESSKRDLEKLIEQLTADIKTRFLESFEDINRHFKSIFTQIFGPGSHAELELTTPDDVLNSGIEIKAAPPGKVIKNLISLSGGEKTMVAITIYFAILMHRPTPFCMLDEVDAALDEVNVDKYIRYLNQFSRKTQLMVITHRRGTIEGCSVLYGVFMQEKGVSRLLRQELSDELSDELNEIIK
ncbi:MAG: chromosome segregation protein SMC [Oscillospiraceae bacterium]|nr:chromosome segregation protein SMC [Oscillospiraceae bacterium]